ncbi:AtpZ/AtpI family protein [Candidatus Epulonipiscium viviparus]|uniref:AtpZ/AtpI family protein n=1 Tax=Candidatus Epulonipiscium viviparus TaxID=420336 RepID=UPI00016C0D9B|nr:AtpZ/AtpI family protein [Candidatus Epulopiscium viviparus]
MSNKKGILTAFALVSQLGFTMIIPIFLCFFVGIFLDRITNLSPLFLIISIFLGVGAAFRNMFFIILRETKKGAKK